MLPAETKASPFPSFFREVQAYSEGDPSSPLKGAGGLSQISTTPRRRGQSQCRGQIP